MNAFEISPSNRAGFGEMNQEKLNFAQNLLETMIKVCEVVTNEPEGGSAMVPLERFVRLYAYLAGLSCSGKLKSTSAQQDNATISTDEQYCSCAQPFLLLCTHDFSSDGTATCSCKSRSTQVCNFPSIPMCAHCYIHSRPKLCFPLSF